MFKKTFAGVLMIISSFLCVLPVQASPVSYAAELHTTKLLPVTNVLIMEQDTEGTVHGTVYGQNVSGNGQAVISHNPPFTPVRSLIIGITDGLTPEGEDKTQIIMFLNREFATSIQGTKWSEVFPGTRHSTTIESLIAISSGDTEQLEWFTDTFFTGVAAPAVFKTGEDFTVGEFSAFDVIGGASAVGNWVLNNPIQILAFDDPDAISNYPTAVIDETATSTGPFDVELQLGTIDVLDSANSFAMKKTVVNGTSRSITQFALEIGRGLGVLFTPRDGTSGPEWVAFNTFPVEETSGAFPDHTWSQNKIVFNGSLEPGETAIFIFTGSSTTPEPKNVTVRQSTGGLIFNDSFEGNP